MARFTATVESSAALVATAPSGANANALFAAIVAGSSQRFRLRKLIFGVRAGASAPTSQQLTVAAVRTTARGTATTTVTPSKTDTQTGASQITGVDTAWSAVPTAVWTAPYLYEWSFNSQSGVIDLIEAPDEISCPLGTANGIAFINVGNALPASHLYTATLVWEE